MSAVALQARRAVTRVAVTTTVVSLVASLAVVVALLVLTWGTWGDINSDTGYDIVAGTRVAHGDVPYHDFTYYYGPLAPYLMGLAALLGGGGLAPAIVLGLIVTFAILIATFLVGLRVAGPTGAFLATTIAAAVAFIPDNFSYVLPHTNDATIGTLLLLCILLAIDRFAHSSRERWLLALGGCAGLIFLTKPEPAVAGLCAVVAWLTIGLRDGRLNRRGAGIVLVSLLSIPAIVYGLLLTRVSAHSLVFENLYPRAVFKAGGQVGIRDRMPLTLSSIATVGEKLVLYAVCVALVGFGTKFLARSKGGRAVWMILGSLGFVAAVVASVADPEALRHGLQYAYGWIPAGALIAAGILTWRILRGDSEDWSPTAQVCLAGTVALAVLAATTYVGFFPHAAYEQMAVYAIPLAAVFLARLHLRELGASRVGFALGALWLAFLGAAGVGLGLKDASAESGSVRGPGGALTASPLEASLYNNALGWIERTTKPGDPILVAPMMTALYPLSGRTNPLREISLLPSALPRRTDEFRTIAALKKARVQLILTDDRVWPSYGNTSFGRSFDRVLDRWIRINFALRATEHLPAHETVEGLQPPRTLFVWMRRQ